MPWFLQDFDILEDLDSRVMGDAWLWLPFTTRCMVLQVATDLAQLAVSTAEASKTRLLCLAADANPETRAVSMSGVPQQPDNEHAIPPCSSQATAPQVQLVLHGMAHLLADTHDTVCTPLLTALEIVNLGATVSKPDESLFTTSLPGSSSERTFSGSVSSTDSCDMFADAPPVVAAEASLYMLLLRAYLAASKAVAIRDQSCQWVLDSSPTSSGDTALQITDGSSDQPAAQAELSSVGARFLPSVALTTYSVLRLFWVAVMGDVAFWQEAMHIMSKQKQGGPFAAIKRAVLFAGLSALQLVAAASWVSKGLLPTGSGMSTASVFA